MTFLYLFLIYFYMFFCAWLVVGLLALLVGGGVGAGGGGNSPCRKLVLGRLTFRSAPSCLSAGVEHMGLSASVSVAYWLAVIVTVG